MQPPPAEWQLQEEQPAGGGRRGGEHPRQLPQRFVNSSDTVTRDLSPQQRRQSLFSSQILEAEVSAPEGAPCSLAGRSEPDGPRKNAPVSSAEWGDRPMPGPAFRGTSATSMTSHSLPEPRFQPLREWAPQGLDDDSVLPSSDLPVALTAWPFPREVTSLVTARAAFLSSCVVHSAA